MLGQSLLTLLATVLGGILATVGGIAANYYTQVFNNRAERQKFIREKCEEAYLLADQVKLWAKNENHRWWQKYYEEFEPDSDELAMYRKEFEPIDCPINKLMMIITHGSLIGKASWKEWLASEEWEGNQSTTA